MEGLSPPRYGVGGRNMPLRGASQYQQDEEGRGTSALRSTPVRNVNSFEQDESSHHNIIYQVIYFCGFLHDFAKPDVRRSFLAGDYTYVDHSEKMLASIDKIVQLMLPAGYLSPFSPERDERVLSGVKFFINLVRKSESYPRDHEGRNLPVSKTFAEWYSYLEALTSRSHWPGSRLRNLDSSQHSFHGFPENLPVDQEGSPVGEEVKSSVPPLDLLGPSVKFKNSAVRRALFDSDSNNPDNLLSQQAGTASRAIASSTRPEVNVDGIQIKPVLPSRMLGEREPTPGLGREQVTQDKVKRVETWWGGNQDHHPHTRLEKEVPYIGAVKNEYHVGPDVGAPHVEIQPTWETPPPAYHEEMSDYGLAHKYGVFVRSRGIHKSGAGRYHSSPGGEDAARNPKGHDSRLIGQIPTSALTHNRVSSGSSDATSSSESERGSWRSSRRSSRKHSVQREMLKAFSTMRFPREAVPPVVFEMESGTSLKRHLQEYEAFFIAKYDGSDRQKGSLLVNYLKGTIKQAYDAIRGSQMKYSDIKPLLLDWYRKERPSALRKYESDFADASMKSDETLTIFAMRLEKLSEKVFRDEWERERRLCRRYWEAVPEAFSRVLAESERNLALTTDRKKLGWSTMKRLAEAEDRRAKRFKSRQPQGFEASRLPQHADYEYQRECMMTGPQGLPSQKSSWRRGDTNQYRDSGMDPNRPAPRGNTNGNKGEASWKSKGFEERVCHWCGRLGHLEPDCWRKNGCCQFCGSAEHTSSNCQSFGRDRTGFTPTCSSCQGNHLGQFCPQIPSNEQALSDRS